VVAAIVCKFPLRNDLDYSTYWQDPEMMRILKDYEERSIANGLFMYHSHTVNYATNEMFILELGTSQHAYQHWYMNTRDKVEHEQGFPGWFFLNFSAPTMMSYHGLSAKYAARIYSMMEDPKSPWAGGNQIFDQVAGLGSYKPVKETDGCPRLFEPNSPFSFDPKISDFKDYDYSTGSQPWDQDQVINGVTLPSVVSGGSDPTPSPPGLPCPPGCSMCGGFMQPICPPPCAFCQKMNQKNMDEWQEDAVESVASTGSSGSTGAQNCGDLDARRSKCKSARVNYQGSTNIDAEACVWPDDKSNDDVLVMVVGTFKLRSDLTDDQKDMLKGQGDYAGDNRGATMELWKEWESRSVVKGLDILHSHTVNWETGELNIVEVGTSMNVYKHWYIDMRDWIEHRQQFDLAQFVELSSGQLAFNGMSKTFGEKITTLLKAPTSRWKDAFVEFEQLPGVGVYHPVKATDSCERRKVPFEFTAPATIDAFKGTAREPDASNQTWVDWDYYTGPLSWTHDLRLPYINLDGECVTGAPPLLPCPIMAPMCIKPSPDCSFKTHFPAVN